jgi:hypothetical protein
MSTWTSPPKPLSFPVFWEFVKDHANCILGASWGPAVLFDDESLHWALFEQEERRVVIQLIRGKNLVAELMVDGREVDEVEIAPDPENPQSGHYLAELLSSASKGRESIGHFLLAHGMEDMRSHPMLRH